MTKICSKCGAEKDESCFSKDKQKKDGLYPSCKDCVSVYNKEYNRRPGIAEKKAGVWATWKAENPERLEEAKKLWIKENRDHIRISHRQLMARQRLADPNMKLGENLRTRLNMAVENGSKRGSAVRDLGCTISELRVHLESKFQPGMSWRNYGKGRGKWHIDHIMPLCVFDLTDRQHVVLACHYLNLQPLWSKDNLRKLSLDLELRRSYKRVSESGINSE